MRLRIASLQARIIVFFVVLMLVVQLGGLLLIKTVGTSNARDTIADELATGERVFIRLVQQNTSQLAQGARILASDYAFREALTSRDDETIVSALNNHGDRIHAQLMMLVGLDRRVVADTRAGIATGAPFPLPILITEAERRGLASSMVVLSGRLYQIVVVPVAAPLPVAWVVMGFAIDDEVAREWQRVTGLEVTFLTRDRDRDWVLQASTMPAAKRPAVAESMRIGAYDGLADPGDDDYLTRVSRQAASNDQSIVAVLQVSLESALGRFHSLMHQLAGIALIGILVSIAFSVVIARGIAQPVKQLASFARRIAAGDYADAPRIEREDEIGDLSTAFEHMRAGIETREQKITELAYRDTLTGLPNRALFGDRLQQAINTARRAGTPVCVLMMDLDRFKYVNDTLGHYLGDELLRRVAERLSSVVKRDSDTIARLGGDEFAILLPTDDVDGGRKVAQKVQAALDAPMTLDGHMVDVRASLGLAVFPDHGDDLDGLVRRADVAMYLAKRNNTGFAIYDARYDQHTAERLSLMGELREAVEQDQLVLYYQPKVVLADPPRHCVEALIRWQHPRRGFVPPAEFIPFAEQTGYIRAVTMWVLERAIAQCARWRGEGLVVQVSVNISARDLLNPDLPTRFAQLLATHDCPAEQLWLEITESAILEDTTHALANLVQLAALGCKLSIDDYGTGYSSLSYLKKLPVDELKIDRSFVMNMLSDREDRVIVQSTIDLAHNMGLKVTAEGVEDQETFDGLRAMGCDMAQGFLMSKPLPAEDLTKWMKESRWVAARPDALLRVG